MSHKTVEGVFDLLPALNRQLRQFHLWLRVSQEVAEPL